MTDNSCPHCTESFDAAGSLRDHTWDAHDACHYCGKQIANGDIEELYRHWLIAHEGDLSRMDRNRAESEIDEISVSDRYSDGGLSRAMEVLPRRKLLLGAGGIAAGAVAIGGIAALSGGTGVTTVEAGDPGPVASAPVPESAHRFKYAVMGSADAEIIIGYYGNWKCPYCAEFSTGFLEDLVEEYVVPGDIAIGYRNLTYIDGGPFLGPDTPEAARAGLAVWNSDPDSYWRYHEVIMQNQPPERQQWATADQLVEFARAADVDEPEVIRTAIQEQRYEDAIQATSSSANEKGITGTPTLVVGDETVSPFKEQRTRQMIENALSSG